MSSAQPMSSVKRISYYLRQTGRPKMTERQERRNRKKNRRAKG